MTIIQALNSESFEIGCKFYGYEWSSLGERYTCGASLVEVQNESTTTVSSVSGDHILNRTNADVKAVEFSGQKTYYIIQNLVDFFPHMEELYVFRSDLKKLSRSDFTNYKNFKAVSLSRNHLSTVPYETFEDLINLEYFSLSFNQLTSIPNLKTLPQLQELYLFENSIESFSKDDISGNPNLKVIWLYQNKLKVIDPRIFPTLTNLREIDLSNNNCIDRKYSADESEDTNSTLINIVDEIKKNCAF